MRLAARKAAEPILPPRAKWPPLYILYYVDKVHTHLSMKNNMSEPIQRKKKNNYRCVPWISEEKLTS